MAEENAGAPAPGVPRQAASIASRQGRTWQALLGDAAKQCQSHREEASRLRAQTLSRLRQLCDQVREAGDRVEELRRRERIEDPDDAADEASLEATSRAVEKRLAR